MEKIIEKIKKVLELSKNNPSKEEAQAAALKAQKLMADYHISMKDVEGLEGKTDITEKCVTVKNGNKWRKFLASVVANNFRCKYFNYNTKGSTKGIVFYGHKEDVEIAAMTFEYLFNTGNKLAANYYQNNRNEAIRDGYSYDGKGIKNSFLLGYVDGIKEVLEKQSTALMIVTPKEVKEKYEERSKDFVKSSYTIRVYQNNNNNIAREKGVFAGRNTIQSKQLAMA